MSRPGPHPGPPPDFLRRPVPVIEYADVLFRTHRRDREPVYFGATGRNRFDDSDGRYGVLYAGRDEYVAFIETFGQSTGDRVITTTALAESNLTRLAAERPLRLIDMVSPGSLARLGADSRLFAGEHDVAQKWSRALHQHSLALADGILYPPRHDPTRHAIALFDRAPDLIPIETLRWHDGGQLRTLLAQILDHYAFDLIETATTPPKKGPKPEVQSSLFE